SKYFSPRRNARMPSTLGRVLIKRVWGAAVIPMSALPPKADMCSATRDVRFGPKADMLSSCEYKSPIFDGLADYVLASWTFISSLIVTRRVWLDPRKPHFCLALWARRQI